MLRRRVGDVSQQASPDVAGFSVDIKASSLNYDSRGGRSKPGIATLTRAGDSSTVSIISRRVLVAVSTSRCIRSCRGVIDDGVERGKGGKLEACVSLE